MDINGIDCIKSQFYILVTFWGGFSFLKKPWFSFSWNQCHLCPCYMALPYCLDFWWYLLFFTSWKVFSLTSKKLPHTRLVFIIFKRTIGLTRWNYPANTSSIILLPIYYLTTCLIIGINWKLTHLNHQSFRMTLDF